MSKGTQDSQRHQGSVRGKKKQEAWNKGQSEEAINRGIRKQTRGQSEITRNI